MRDNGPLARLRWLGRVRREAEHAGAAFASKALTEEALASFGAALSGAQRAGCLPCDVDDAAIEGIDKGRSGDPLA